MTRSGAPTATLRERFWRHERAFAGFYLVCLALLAAFLVAPPLRRVAFGKLESVFIRWEDRWVRRVERGEALAQAGQYERAAEYLAALDGDFPARNVRHRFDKERERILSALGRSYLELGRKRAALDTYRRLVAFDPLNFVNHFTLAMACEHFEEPEEAQQHFAHVLAKHPSHLPSVRHVVADRYARGDFAGVISMYEGYLDAFLIQPTVLWLGDSTLVRIPVDGQMHELEVVSSRPSGWSGQLLIDTRGFPAELTRAVLTMPLIIGATRRDSTVLSSEQASVPHQAGSADSRSAVRLPVTPLAHPVGRIRLRLRLFKPVDPVLWDMVRRSYRNRLELTRMAGAASRTVLLESTEVADRIGVPVD